MKHRLRKKDRKQDWVIEERRRRDAAERQREQSEMLIAEIREVFRGIKLGEGRGLYEAKGIAYYEYEDKLARLRRKDEKDDWQALRTRDLNYCRDALLFFDKAGMRFHLPAFLVAAIQGGWEQYMARHLTELGKWRWRANEQYATLKPAERQVVRKFLERLLEREELYDRPRIIMALKTYWKD